MVFRLLAAGARRTRGRRAAGPGDAVAALLGDDDVADAFDQDVPAFVFKLGHYPFHHGGVGAVRSLGRLGIAVYANVGDRWAPLAWSRFLRKRFVWVVEANRPDDVLAGLLEISDTIGRVAVIIPTDDEAALFVAEHRDELEGRFLAAAPAPDVIRSVSDKAALAATCRRIGVPTPAITCPSSLEELSEFLDNVRFPVVIKAVDAGQVRTQKLRSTTITADRDEAWDIGVRYGFGQGAGLIFQEYIPGGEDWFFHGCCDHDSRLVVGYSGVKVRSYPAYVGPTSYGRWEENDALTRQVQCLLEATGYQGVFDLDLRLDPRDGKYKLLDFNPRVGAQFRLFEDEQEIDVVRALHLFLTDRMVPGVKPRPGRTFMLETSDPVGLLRYRRHGEATFGEWVSEARAVDEWAWCARDDALPAVITVIGLMVKHLRRASNGRGLRVRADRLADRLADRVAHRTDAVRRRSAARESVRL